MCNWYRNNFPEWDGDIEEVIEQIEEDTCNEHGIFLCGVCFPDAHNFVDSAGNPVSFQEEMEEDEFLCDEHGILLCEKCFNWNAIQEES